MKASNPPFHRLSHHCKSIFAALSLILLASCHSTSALSGANPAEIDAISMAEHAAPSVDVGSQFCFNCESIADVHRFEKERGSTQLPLTDGEIMKAFEGYCFSRITKNDTTNWMTDSTAVASTLNYWEIYLRPRSQGSNPNIAVLYFFTYPVVKIDFEHPKKPVLRLHDYRAKCFYDDPVLMQYLMPHQNTSKVDVLPDSKDVAQLYAALKLQLQNLGTIEGAVEEETKDEFYKENGFSEGGKMYYYALSEDTSDSPLMPGAHDGPSALGILQPPPYQSLYLDTHWYLSADDPETYATDWMHLELRWAASLDHYIRSKVRHGQRFHRFEIQPSDLAIYFDCSFR